MSLRISTTPALIGININQGKMNIDYPKGNFNIDITQPQTELEIEQVKVKIDQTKPLAEIGLKNYVQFTKEYANKGKQTAMQGIARIVSEGNELASIEGGASVISIQAERNAFGRSKKEVNYDAIPKSRPKIDITGGTVEARVHKGEVNIDLKAEMPSISYIRGNVDIYIKQRHNIDIEYTGNNLDVRI